jgi:hypothetical protein
LKFYLLSFKKEAISSIYYEIAALEDSLAMTCSGGTQGFIKPVIASEAKQSQTASGKMALLSLQL